MDANVWIARCSSRLHEQWPRVDLSDMDHLADALWADERWNMLEPEVAALQWISQGIPDEGIRHKPPGDEQCSAGTSSIGNDSAGQLVKS